MVSKYFRMTVFLLLFCIMLSDRVSAKRLYLESANITYTVDRSGYVHVVEDVDYFLADCKYTPFHELYRELPLGLPFGNATGYCIGDNCTFRYDPPDVSVSGNPELILELDRGCGEVTAHFEYDVYTLIRHNDTVQFYYKVWGDRSPKVFKLDIHIILPGEANRTVLFVHPWDADIDVESVGNKINLHTEFYPEHTFLEVNLLMPVDWFNRDGPYIPGGSCREEIIRGEESDRTKFYVIGILKVILSAVIILLPWMLGMYYYYVYGREYTPEEVGYLGIYEREPPSDHPPAEVGSLVKGDYDFSNSLHATIISLAAKKWLKIERKDGGKDYVIRIRSKGKPIKPVERKVLDFLKKHAEDGRLSLKRFKDKVSGTRSYYEWYHEWLNELKTDLNLEKYVDKTGYERFTKSVGVLVVVYLFLWLSSTFLSSGWLFWNGLFGVFSGMGALILFTNKKIWLSRWTKEGRLLSLKWNNFKRFLTDFSAMKDYPPQSVVLWEEYLAYAVGLGVADKVVEIMRKINPAFVEKTEELSGFAYSPVFITTFTPSYTPPSSSSSGYSGSTGGWSGGFSGSGGGFGGGGFGGR
ncbi:DUF2207 domain-containing protein [Candidatus Micrarchaeota archaeon]|nr:DUF2207 domain-containing protein [Candidatus Micrarchaeota archaeon]